MIILKRDVTDPAAAPFLTFSAWHPNADGTVSLQMPDGTFAYQEPMQYGLFKFAPSPDGVYQHAKLNGQLVAFWTRPQDPPFVYSWAELPN
jgi:hypothetical protein